MDIAIIVIGSLLIIIGFLGSILPVLPGPPLAFISLPLLYLHSYAKVEVSSTTLVIYGLMVLFITLIDYYLPVWGTKKFGGTRAGKIGSTVGLIAALFLAPIFNVSAPLAIIISPFLGALIGELIVGEEMKLAVRSGIGSFVGFLGGVFLKAGICIAIAIQFVKWLR